MAGNPKKRLILHCGLPKAGTTSVQTWLFGEREYLASQGTEYPGPYAPHEPKQAYLVSALCRPKAAGLPEIEKHLRQATADTVILSNEGLSNHLYDFDAEALRQFRALTRGYETTVVLVTRPKEAWLPSYHAQCVINPKRGSSDLWGTHLTRDEIRDHPRVKRLMDHETLAHDLTVAFGAVDCVQLSMETPDWFEGLLTVFGLDPSADRPLPRSNLGIPGWAIEVLRQVNSLSDDRGQWLAWRQKMAQILQADSVQLTLAAEEPGHEPDPKIRDAIMPRAEWTPDEANAFRDFMAALDPPEAAAPAQSLKPSADNADVPRTIWMLWLQGWDTAPDIVQASRASWVRQNPAWTFHFLDRQTVSEHLSVPLVARIFGKERPPYTYADQIRLELLIRYGGVWADATTICAQPLDQWLPPAMTSGFFAFDQPGAGRLLSNWFLAARPDNYILKSWLTATWDYWSGRDEMHDYFWMHGLFKELYETDPVFAKQWDATPKISARHRFHFGPDSPALFKKAPADLSLALASPPAPVFKLTYKLSAHPEPDSLFAHLIRYAAG